MPSVGYTVPMWTVLLAAALAVDLDVTVTAPGAPPANVTFKNIVPGPLPAAILAPWFDGKQCRVSVEVFRRRGGYQIEVELAELRVLEDGAVQIVVVKNERLKLADDKRTLLTLERPLSDGQAEAWTMEANVSGLPKKAATEEE